MFSVVLDVLEQSSECRGFFQQQSAAFVGFTQQQVCGGFPQQQAAACGGFPSQSEAFLQNKSTQTSSDLWEHMQWTPTQSALIGGLSEWVYSLVFLILLKVLDDFCTEISFALTLHLRAKWKLNTRPSYTTA